MVSPPVDKFSLPRNGTFTKNLFCFFYLFILILFNNFVSFLGASMMLAELAMEAGLPSGVLNIVHGTHVCFFLLTHIVVTFCHH